MEAVSEASEKTRAGKGHRKERGEKTKNRSNFLEENYSIITKADNML